MQSRRRFLERLFITGIGVAGGFGLATTVDLWRAAAAMASGSRARSGIFVVTDLPFRARGDGIANDGPAIQAAIDAAAESGGGVVVLPAGIYRLASIHEQPGIRFFLLNIWSRVTLMGQGMDRTILKAGEGLPDQTRILSTASTDGRWRVVNTTFMDFTLDGNSAAQMEARSNVGISCVQADDARHLRVRVQDVKGGAGDGGEGAGFDSFYATGSVYRDCEARRVGAGSTGSGFSATKSRDISYEDCRSSGSTDWQGFTTSRSAGIAYLRCHGYQNAQRGLNCEESERVSYQNCLAGGDGIGNGGDGYYLFQSNTITLNACQSAGNQSGIKNVGSMAVQVLGGSFPDSIQGFE